MARPAYRTYFTTPGDAWPCLHTVHVIGCCGEDERKGLAASLDEFLEVLSFSSPLLTTLYVEGLLGPNWCCTRATSAAGY